MATKTPLPTKIVSQQLALVAKTNRRRSADEPNQFWHLFVGDRRVGKAYMSIYTDHRNGAFVTVMINKDAQGRGIGTEAFKRACEESGFDVVYAEVRRNNKPSQRALRRAGFTEFARNASGEDILVWRRSIV